MKDLAMHPVTKLKVETFLKAPSHALLLTGPAGIGKISIAKVIAEQLIVSKNITNHPYFKLVDSLEGKAIGIDQVRELDHFLSLKVPGDSQINRVLIIENANLMTQEAQNSLLKTLEEPPAGTVIIMTSNHEQALLPTIRSRTQHIVVNRPDRASLEAHFAAANHEPQGIAQAYSISGGLPGLMTALLDENDHPLLQATQKARELLSQTAYERLLQVDSLSRQSQLTKDIVFILQQMAHVSLQSSSAQAAARWQKILERSYQASEQLSSNAQAKLVLTNLFLNI